MRKKLFAYALSGALTLGAIGGTITCAAESTDTATPLVEKTAQTGHAFEKLDEATETNVQEIRTRVKEELEALGVVFPEKGDRVDRLANLDEETKAQAEAIRDQVKDGAITREEAQVQLKSLGIDMPEKREKQDLFAELDEATKVKTQAIVEEAEAELSELGVDRSLFGKGHHHGMGRK